MNRDEGDQIFKSKAALRHCVEQQGDECLTKGRPMTAVILLGKSMLVSDDGWAELARLEYLQKDQRCR